MSRNGWQFWIDVGGTFTDCIALAPDGSLRTHKLLSTGRYRGRIGAGSTHDCIVDSARAGDSPEFFAGWRIRISSEDSTTADEEDATVVRFDPRAGVLRLDRPRGAPLVGATYELCCGLEAPLIGIRWLLGKRLDEEIGLIDVRLGTTRGTNALLQRRGARVAFVTTAGHGDVLEIGYQSRPRLFDLHIRKPQPLYERAIEVRERIAADGEVIEPLDRDDARRQLRETRDSGIDSLAICLLNSYRNAAHERELARIARDLGFTHVSVSSQLSPLQRIVPRGETAVIDAYLAPVVRSYIDTIQAGLPDASLTLTTSAGALVPAASFVAKDSVLSGPAAGVVGIAQVAESLGLPEVIGLDMGGTSTDVCRYAGALERRYELALEDRATGGHIRIAAPMLAIETVAAGGGSICGFDGAKPTVGPQSAGADPGPACYGRGGPLCVTDVNLFLGRLVPNVFPLPLDRDAVERRLDEMIDRIANATGRRYAPEELASGYIAIADAHMAAAIRRVSTQRGYDPRTHALVAFGGAGGQHACSLARELGIRTIVLHPLAGILSAYGIGHARQTRFATRDVGRRLDEIERGGLERLFSEMLREAREALCAYGVSEGEIDAPKRSLDLRYAGQDAAINVADPPGGDWSAAFETAHRDLYGFSFPGRSIEVRAARLELTTRSAKPSPRTRGEGRVRGNSPGRHVPAIQSQPVFFAGHWHETPVYPRDDLQSGQSFTGPALIAEHGATAWIEPGWEAQVTDGGAIVLTAAVGAAETLSPSSGRGQGEGQASVSSSLSDCDPIALELFYRRFCAVAEQMGATLQLTALSTNVKERLDFSCAVFDRAGELIAHAPHIPVHLGAMGYAVKCLLEDAARPGGIGQIRPGDVFITNDPYRGGSHLPDVTVITPVFVADEATAPSFFVASRAHHAEIGGITPGSMPPHSRALAEEGVFISTMRLPQSDPELRAVFLRGPWPSRAPDQNLADVRAQAAANHRGTLLLRDLSDQFTPVTVLAYMHHMRFAAERHTRVALGRLSDGEYAFADAMDDGTPIRLSIRKQGGQATFDFTGTGPASPTNLNATPAIVSSAVLYCLRCLMDDAVPLNSGILAPVTITIPPGCLLDPPRSDDPALCPAVVGGNVETSQRVVDCIFGALRTVAASQGTMNNVAFGDATWGYYETICGGAGAGPGFAGAHAVHTQMTNTRLTDPEVLEARYPVRLRRFAIRRGSGGSGRWPGGDGVIREIEFLAPLDLSLLTQRRTTRPYGMDGGDPGLPGVNRLIRCGGPAIDLGSAAHIRLAPGDLLHIETPGGGGWGARAGNDLL